MALKRSPYETGRRRMQRGLLLQFTALGFGVLGVSFAVSLNQTALIPWVVLVAIGTGFAGSIYAYGALTVVCPKCFRSVFPYWTLFGIGISPFETCPRCGNDNTAAPASQD